MALNASTHDFDKQAVHSLIIHHLDRLRTQELIYKLESSLLTPQVRNSTEHLNALIAEEFIEHGSSGLIYNKKDLLDSLPKEKPKNYFVENFSALELSPEVMLVTYRVTLDSKCSLRSSLWKYKNNHWEMIFHQGTSCPNT